MTGKDLSTIYRAPGIIEGVAAGMSDEEAAVLLQAIDMIDAALENKNSEV